MKLLAGREESLNIKLTGAGGKSYHRVLHRNKPLSWKLNGRTYQILYPQTAVALDQPAESPFASIIVTCRAKDEQSDASSSQEKKKSDADSRAHNDTNAPMSHPTIPAATAAPICSAISAPSAAPILAEMAEKGGYGLADGQAIRRVPPPFPECE